MWLGKLPKFEKGRLIEEKELLFRYQQVPEFKGDMMKSVSASVCKVILAVFLSALIFLPFGCTCSQPGETTAEGNRRHQRNLRINQQETMKDVDASVLLDEPSRLSDKRIP